jgi:hypothetical protein
MVKMKLFSYLKGWIEDIVYFLRFSCNSNVTIGKVQVVIPKILDGVMTEEEIVSMVRDWFNLPEENSLGIMTHEFNRESLLKENVRVALVKLQEKRVIKMSTGDGPDDKICPVYSKIIGSERRDYGR